jgi:hypothetical protein
MRFVLFPNGYRQAVRAQFCGRSARVALTALGLALLAVPFVSTPASATPVCTGPDRLICGGRIIPEPMQSAGFLTYAEWQDAMRTLQHEHPDRVRVDDIGQTAGGLPVYDVIVTDFSAPTKLSARTGLYFNGDIHGDERDGTEGFARVIEDLAESKDPGVLQQLGQEVLVFTDANPDGWASGDIPGPQESTYTRENAAVHDLNREWPVVGYQNPDTFPLGDPEVQSIVKAHGLQLHRKLGIRFAYAFDVHGSATFETPPSAQLMLDMLLSAGQLDLTRSLEQTQVASTYMANLRATANDNVLATIGEGTDEKVYKVGDWDTSWDIYGYAVSGGYADWMGSQYTGLGAVSGTIELWINGEPGQENTFVGYDQLVEASNVHSMRVAVGTAMNLAARHQRAALRLPGPIAYVANRFSLGATDGQGSTAPVGPADARPPGHPYPSTNNRFFSDLATFADHSVVRLDAAKVTSASQLTKYSAVVVAQDAHLDAPAFLAALRGYAGSGGTVLLTDGALRALGGMGLVDPNVVGTDKVYAGYIDVTNRDDPMAAGLRDLSRQTYEPVPLGYELSNTFSSTTSVNTAPAWWVDRPTWEAAGGRTVGTTGDGKTSLGELKVGKGRVRIIGSLLPNPSGDYAHPFGVADYALTYVGYTLFDNAIAATASLVNY